MGKYYQSSAARRDWIGVLAAVLLVVPFSFAGGGKGKLARELQGVTGADSVDVIVQYNSVPTDKHAAKIAGKGGAEKQRLQSIRGSAASVPKNKLEELASDPDVKHISPDRPLKMSLNNSTAAVFGQYAWGLGYDGTGIGVAVIDSGIHLIDDL